MKAIIIAMKRCVLSLASRFLEIFSSLSRVFHAIFVTFWGKESQESQEFACIAISCDIFALATKRIYCEYNRFFFHSVYNSILF
jgi:hypothetical protein